MSGWLERWVNGTEKQWDVVQDDKGAYAGNQAVGDVVQERNANDENEGWNGVAVVRPVDGDGCGRRSKEASDRLTSSNSIRNNSPLLAIIEPTMIKVQPVAQDGMLAKMGAKKSEMKKRNDVMSAERPVLPPSAIPAALSMNAVDGELPMSAPMEMANESARKAVLEPSKSFDTSS